MTNGLVQIDAAKDLAEHCFGASHVFDLLQSVCAVEYIIGEVAQRLTLDVMRETGRPLNSLEITAKLLARKGIEATAAITARIQKNVFAVIHRLEARNVVREIDNGAGVMTWEIV